MPLPNTTSAKAKPVALHELLKRQAMLLRSQADVNLRMWGQQDFETLGLAASEELGELCREILQAQEPGSTPERIRAEAIDLGALCLQILAHRPPTRGG